ncbi:hypothetical protein I350_00642 [Cryptococcus amylolentus CBS 6273]|uniref:Uncharacterized protein n=1 Tax=Cryptococcus amylolentus CBS 6273 TaxID=1296118 RepID=A0A1E3KFJ0_9TREE|nr:hypothetical protein I350_00642 [Cryptococcus amylolentus CBS 6273]
MPKDASHLPRKRGRPRHLYKDPKKVNIPTTHGHPTAAFQYLSQDADAQDDGHLQAESSSIFIDPTLGSALTNNAHITDAELSRHLTPLDAHIQSQAAAIVRALTLHEESHGQLETLDCQQPPPAPELQQPIQRHTSYVNGTSWVGRLLSPERAAERQALWDIVASCDYLPDSSSPKADLSAEKLNGPGLEMIDVPPNSGFVKPTRQKKLDGEEYMREVIEVEDIPRYFDGLPHDYNALSRARCSSYLKIVCLDPPGLVPTDIRSRHIHVSVDDNALRDNPDGYVYRIIFRCSGICLRADGEEQSMGVAGEEGQPWMGEQPKNFAQSSSETKKRRPPACDSLLAVEMTARQAADGQCTIIRRRPEYHPPGPTAALRLSPYIRSVLHELASDTGMPNTRLRSEYENRLRTAAYPMWIEANFPHRLPKPQHYLSVTVTIARAAKKAGHA